MPRRARKASLGSAIASSRKGTLESAPARPSDRAVRAAAFTDRPGDVASRKGAGSLREALIALGNDRAFLTRGDVFSDDQIDAYIELKWEEQMRWETTPSPVEYDMYYSS